MQIALELIGIRSVETDRKTKYVILITYNRSVIRMETVFELSHSKTM